MKHQQEMNRLNEEIARWQTKMSQYEVEKS